jgi:hypothetical protein
MRRQQAGKTFAANAPAPVNENFSPATEARQKISCCLVGAHDACGRHRFLDSHVNELIQIQRLADWKVFNPGARLHIRRAHASHLRARAVNCHVSQLRLRPVHIGALTECIEWPLLQRQLFFLADERAERSVDRACVLLTLKKAILTVQDLFKH